MHKQTIMRLVVIAVLLLVVVWWLLPSDGENIEADLEGDSTKQNLVSAIQPINDADALTTTEKLPEVQTRALQFTPQANDLEDFERAIDAIQAGQLANAEELLESLIKRQPGLLEPYINLASAQALTGDLGRARETLMQGLNANENYGALFSNLQKVHAALAADAYRLALAEDPTAKPGSNSKRLQLPLVTALNANIAPGDEKALAGANARIEELQTSLKAQQQNLTARQEELAAANSILQTKDSTVLSLKEELKVATSAATLNDQATNTAAQKAEALQTRLTAAQQQIAQMLESHQNELAALKLELQQQQNGLAEQELLAKQEQQRQTQKIAQLEQDLAAQEATAAAIVAAPPSSGTPVASAANVIPPADTALAVAALEPSVAEPVAAENPSTVANTTTSGDQDQFAIEHVKSWAAAWSAQDVSGYVSHYQNGYTPAGSSMSHAEWLAQRQVRLTNKKFIDVSVNDFSTQLDGDVLKVNFVQRYRSNTMDDTIRKQLRLVTENNDWSQPRIVSEQVLR